MIIIDKATGELVTTNDPNILVVEEFLQELRLWKGENPLDIEAGIDYTAVLNREAFLKVEVDRVVQKHILNFKDIIVGDIIEHIEEETIELPIDIYLLDNSVVSHSITLENR